MNRVTKAQVTEMLQAMLNDSLNSNDERHGIVDDQSPLIETEEGWEVDFGTRLDVQVAGQRKGPAFRTYGPPVGQRTLKLQITAEQKINLYDEEEDLIEGPWRQIVSDEQQASIDKIVEMAKKPQTVADIIKLKLKKDLSENIETLVEDENLKKDWKVW